MRRLFVALLFLVPAISFAATLESRSLQHAMTIEPLAGSDECIVTVTEIATGKRLAAVRMTLKNDAAEASLDDVGLHVRIRLARLGNGISASLEVSREGTVVDSIESQWRSGPKALRVGGDVKVPMIIHKVEPHYPDEAKEARIAGIVILEVLIDKTGAVKEVAVLKPLPFGLSKAAVDAVRQWTFVPATKDGQAVDVIFNLTMNFKLDGSKSSER